MVETTTKGREDDDNDGNDCAWDLLWRWLINHLFTTCCYTGMLTAFRFHARLAGFATLSDGGHGSGGHPIPASHRKAERPNSSTMLAVMFPVLTLACSRAVAREPTPGARVCRSCRTGRAGITANHPAQFDFEKHPLGSLRIQQIREWTIGQVK